MGPVLTESLAIGYDNDKNFNLYPQNIQYKNIVSYFILFIYFYLYTFLKEIFPNIKLMIISEQESDVLDVLIDGMTILLKLLNNARHHY